MIRALIFDFNGVLANDDPIHMSALRKVSAEEGFYFSDEEYVSDYLPRNDRDCFQMLFSKHSLPLTQEKLAALIERKGFYHFQAIARQPVLFSAAANAVRKAAERRPLAIASGARREEILYILKEDQLEVCFSAIVAAEDVEFGKPHPEPFSRAYERLREKDPALTASECVAIEDSIGGIQSAHAAGMRCLAIAHSYQLERLRSASPEWIIGSIAEFVSWMEKEIPR